MKPVSRMTKKERAAVLRDTDAKLSDLLEISALDAIALQKQKRVNFDMSIYVSSDGPKCSVCLFGAALFRDIGITDAPNIGFIDDPGLMDNAMRVNSARAPDWDHEMTEEEYGIVDKIVTPEFKEKLERAPFRTYLKAARKLREAGL